MTDPVGFALIGASGIARAHAEALQRCPSTRLLAVCSRDRSRAEALARTAEARPTADYEAILADPAIDAVAIVTEPSRHVELALPALAAGKHLLIEKPLDVDLGRAGRLLAEVARSTRCATVVAPRRFEPALLQLRRRLDAGELGDLELCLVTMLLHRDRAYYDQAPGWRKRDGSVLINQAIHWVDVLLWLCGAPREIRATLSRQRPYLETYDTAVVSARHASGAVSSLVASTACSMSAPDVFQLHGQRGVFVRDARAPGRLGRIAGRLLGGAPAADPFGAQLLDMVDSIRSGAPPRMTVQDAYDALSFVKACEASASWDTRAPEPPTV
jgi:predicted dehydrogenase